MSNVYDLFTKRPIEYVDSKVEASSVLSAVNYYHDLEDALTGSGPITKRELAIIQECIDSSKDKLAFYIESPGNNDHYIWHHNKLIDRCVYRLKNSLDALRKIKASKK